MEKKEEEVVVRRKGRRRRREVRILIEEFESKLASPSNARQGSNRRAALHAVSSAKFKESTAAEVLTDSKDLFHHE